MRRRTASALLAAGTAVALSLSACGAAATHLRRPARRAVSDSYQLPSAVTQSGSGAVIGTPNSARDPAGLGGGAVDAVYGPPDSAISIQDVPDGDTGLVAQNGTPSASWTGAAARARLASDYQAPTDQNFSARWFARDSPWNDSVVSLPVDLNSGEMLKLAGYRVSVTQHGGHVPTTTYVKDDSGLFINTVAWTDPVVQGGPETPVHCRQTPNCGDDPDNRIKDLTIPRDVNPNPYYDGWFTVISPNGKLAYDMWRARRLAGGSMSFEYMRIWNLQGSGYGGSGIPSARGSGLPLFAGLIRPAELEQGQVDHALAISLPSPAQRYYVAPASTTDGGGPLDSVPEGARIRLKADIRIPADSGLSAIQRRYASALMWTLRNYGAIVVDRSAVPTLYGQQGVTAALLSGNELQFLHLSDFQVVNLPAERQYPSTAATGDAAAVVAGVGADGGGY